MNKKNFEKLSVLLRQIQSINKVIVDTANTMEAMRDNEHEAGPGAEAAVYEKNKFELEMQQLDLTIIEVFNASTHLDAAEKALKHIISP